MCTKGYQVKYPSKRCTSATCTGMYALTHTCTDIVALLLHAHKYARCSWAACCVPRGGAPALTSLITPLRTQHAGEPVLEDGVSGHYDLRWTFQAMGLGLTRVSHVTRHPALACKGWYKSAYKRYTSLTV